MYHGIERFSFFQGTLHIAGWVHAPDAEIAHLELVLPDGSAFPISVVVSSDRDSSGLLGVEAQAAHFRETVQLPITMGEVVNATLKLNFKSNASVSIANLGSVTNDPAHALVARFQAMIRDRPAGHLLEVGSRARSGVTRSDLAPPGWDYSGLDILAGPNVDTVGDAHRLSSLYPARHFDAVMSFSVLEHLLMPWKFVVELNRVLKPGALGVFTTHQCWPLHDQPWDFWRFSDKAWAGLLNAATGFEIIDAQMGEHCYIVAAKCHPAVAFDGGSAGGLASFVLFRKTGETALDWPVDLNAITETFYPSGTIDIHNAAP